MMRIVDIVFLLIFIQKKADAAILEIKRNQQKLAKLGDNLVREKFLLQKTERKDEQLKSIKTDNSAVLLSLSDIPPP